MRTRTMVLAALLVALVCTGGAALAQEAKPETKSETKISGRVFADLSYKDYEVGGEKTDDTGFGVDIKRFYFGVAHTFDSNWSAAIVMDKGNKASCSVDAIDVDGDGTPDDIECSASGGDNKRYDVFVKNAFVQYKFSDAAMFRLGAASNPWISLSEELYGQRYIENTLIDRERVKYGESADWGLHFLGKALDGKVNYAVSAINGLGYSDPKRTKTMDLEGRVGVLPAKGLTLGAGFYTGKRGQETETAPAVNTATRYNAVAAYQAKTFKVGAEWFSAKNWYSVTRTLPETETADGFSLYAQVFPTEKVAIFGRYDDTTPDRNNIPDLTRTYFNGGVQYKFNKSFTGALVYKDEQADTGNPSTEGSFSEFGVFMLYNF